MIEVLIFPAIGLLALIWTFYGRYKELTVGGWRQLAERHPGLGESLAVIKTYRHQSIRLSWWGRYNNCINIIVTENGFQMQPQWPFARKRPPIFFYWSDVKNLKKSQKAFGGVTFDVDEYNIWLLGLGRSPFHQYLLQLGIASHVHMSPPVLYDRVPPR